MFDDDLLEPSETWFSGSCTRNCLDERRGAPPPSCTFAPKTGRDWPWGVRSNPVGGGGSQRGLPPCSLPFFLLLLFFSSSAMGFPRPQSNSYLGRLQRVPWRGRDGESLRRSLTANGPDPSRPLSSVLGPGGDRRGGPWPVFRVKRASTFRDRRRPGCFAAPRICPPLLHLAAGFGFPCGRFDEVEFPLGRRRGRSPKEEDAWTLPFPLPLSLPAITMNLIRPFWRRLKTLITAPSGGEAK